MVTSLSALPDLDRIALVDDRGSCTFRELDARVNRLINGLGACGVGRESTLGVLVGNQREFFEIATALGHMGATYVPINWHWTAEEVAYVVDDADISCLLVDEQFVDSAAAVVAATTLDDAAIVVTGKHDGPFVSYESLLAEHSDEPPSEEFAGTPMFYTSGTTGRPKGVRATGGTRAPGGKPVWGMVGPALAKALHMPTPGVQLLCGPVYHTAQWTWTVPILFAGNTIVMRQRFDAEETLRLIDEWEVTAAHFVPTQFIRLLRVDASVRAGFRGTSLAAVWHGAAPCPPDVKHQMIDWWGSVIHEYYGGTEGGVLSRVSSEEWLARPGTVGRIAAGYEVRIADDDFVEQPVGTPGQIWFRRQSGEQFEYHNAPDKTQASRRDGFATLGDIGYFDADGYLFLSDRAIDMVISGGVNIYPAEIEHCLMTNPAVVDVAVIGVPDTEFGEQVKAVVELAPGATAGHETVKALDAHVRSHIAGYKAPRSYEFVDAIPRLASGKALKRELRERYGEPAAS